MQPRPILAPRGLSDAETVRHALRYIGGDLQRAIDRPAGSVNAYVQHVARLEFLRRTSALVCFVSPASLQFVQSCRRMLELPRFRGQI